MNVHSSSGEERDVEKIQLTAVEVIQNNLLSLKEIVFQVDEYLD